MKRKKLKITNTTLFVFKAKKNNSFAPETTTVTTATGVIVQ